MTTDTALIEKREELKRRLAAGEYKTLIDVFLESVDRLLRKVVRRSKPLPTWLITVVLSFALILIPLAVYYVAGDLSTYLNIFGLGYGFGILWTISGSVLTIGGVVVINHYIRRISVFWRDDMIDATESVASLEEFEDWLEKAHNQRLHLLVIIIGGILLGLSLIATMFPRNSFIDYGPIFGMIIISMIAAAFSYLFLMTILLSARLRRYDLKLFAADPSSSELVSRLSGELGFVVYFVVVYGVIGTLLSSSVPGVTALSVGIYQVLLVWLPLIVMFILNQTSLSSIIRRVKWKTLNEIQYQVEELRASNNLKDKETMEAINRLMDFHDRVKATRNSALNSGAILSFINSLLLPLLAFLLGNLDKLIALLPQRP